MKRAQLEILALLAALITTGVMLSQLDGARGLLLGSGMPMFGDFMAFWSAGRLALQGQVAHVHDGVALMAAHREAIPDLDKFFPWRSPPIFLLVMAPLALAPYAVAALLFLGASLSLYLWSLRRLLPDRRALLFAITCPTSVLQIGSVQLSFAITAFTALALHWLERRPLAAGAAIAALVVKPHLAVLWPVMLAVQGRWRTFIAAAIGTIVLALAAGLVFGFDSYARFLADLDDAQGLVARLGLPPNTLASLYANLLYLRAPSWLAIGAHAVSALAAVSICVLIWRRGDMAASGAALAAGTLLISPYLFFYDALLLSVSVALLARGPQSRAAIAIYSFAFLVGVLVLWVGRYLTLPFCPAAAWALLLLALARVTRTETPAALAA